MRDSIRVLILGTGQTGSGIARLVLKKRGLQLAGACARRVGCAGMDLGQAIAFVRDPCIRVDGDMSSVIARTQLAPRAMTSACVKKHAWQEGVLVEDQ